MPSRSPLRRTPIRKKSPRRKLAQAIDLKVKALALERDQNRCVKCGKTQNLQSAHIMPKGRYPRLRFELDNVIILDVGCHLFWAHKDPLGFTEWLEKTRPGLRERLLVMAATARRIDLKEMAIVMGAM